MGRPLKEEGAIFTESTQSFIIRVGDGVRHKCMKILMTPIFSKVGVFFCCHLVVLRFYGEEWGGIQVNIQRLLFVGCGSFLGGMLRSAISTWTTRSLGVFPVGTLIVNILGGFIIGFIMQASLSFWPVSAEMRLFLTTGMMGGLTTFSTFSLETIQFFSTGKYWMMAINIVSNLFLSLLFCWLGGTTAKLL